MCGLIGLLCPSEVDAEAARPAVADAMQCVRHRGPDETGTWSHGEVVLGFNRLSIIDIDQSHQPLHWGPPEAPDRYTILHNGEIYNYLELRKELEPNFPFFSKSDSEALLNGYRAWGWEELLQRIDGVGAPNTHLAAGRTSSTSTFYRRSCRCKLNRTCRVGQIPAWSSPCKAISWT